MGFALGGLPEFPWNLLEPFAARARMHPGGMRDLSVGTPVDPSADAAQAALSAAANAPGYPATYGTPELRQAVADHYARRRGVHGLDPLGVLPTIGSKEFVALLPSMLGLGEGDVVIHPTIAYPTYDLGARVAGATPVACDRPSEVPDAVASRVRLVWLNSPGNPTGSVLSAAQLTDWVRWAAARGAVVACDECYAELAWEEPWSSGGVPSILDARVSGPDRAGVLALYSLSKQSSLAGYRAAWVAGDVQLITRLLELRKHLGMMVPTATQAAMVACLGDDAHVARQRGLYRSRRELLAQALVERGFVIDGSQAGLYLWCRNEAIADCWELVDYFASLGVLVAPGAFYGPGGSAHVRIALTASDEAIAEVVSRLAV